MLHRVLLFAALFVLAGIVAPAGIVPVENASATSCYLDPDNPVPGILCAASGPVSCVAAVAKAVVDKGPINCRP